MINPKSPPARYGFIRGLSSGIAALLLSITVMATESAVRTFDLPADLAVRTLRQFSEQSGVPVVFGTETAAKVRTNAVKGELPPRAALERMLADTGLLVTANPQTGAFTVTRDPNGVRAETVPVVSRPGTRTKNADEVVVLSPFEVRSDRDYGYTSTSSLAGGRLATDLDKTPAAVSVLNRDFLNDVGALTIQEALQWATNSVAANESDVTFEAGSGTARTGQPRLASNNGNIVRTRGIRDSFVSRNYFMWTVDSHSYNTERIDISRGPNALLFGDGGLGGLVNVTTKRARSGSFAHLDVQAVSTGGGLVTVDVNRAVNDKLALRINTLLQDTDGYADFQRDDRKGVFATMTWNPTERTQVRVEGEWGRRNRRIPLAYIIDEGSNWNRAYTLSARLNGTATPPAGTGAARLDTGGVINRPYLVLDIGNPGAGFLDWQGLARTTGSQNPAFPGGVPAAYAALNPTVEGLLANQAASLDGPRTYPVLPSLAWNTNLGARRADLDYHAISAFLEHRIGDRLFLELATNLQGFESHLLLTGNANRLFFDINRALPGGAPNPNFLKPYIEANVARYHHQRRDIWETRASGVYQLENEHLHQRIGVAVSYRGGSEFTDFPRLTRVNGPVTRLDAPENQLRFRQYLDQNHFSIEHLDPDGSYRFGDVAARFVTFNGSGPYSGSDDRLWSAQAFMAGDWLKNRRLSTVLGIRRDHAGRDNFGEGDIEAATRINLGKRKTSTVDTYFTSPSAGAIYRLFPGLSVFANYSESFVDSAGTNINSDPISGRRGRGRDFGFKFDLFESRVTGSIGYYDTYEVNNLISNQAMGNAVNGLWSDMGSDERIINTVPDTQRASATGYEIDLTANLLPNWSLLLNAGIPTSELEDAAPGYRLYFEKNRPIWEAYAANPSTPAAIAASMQNRLAVIDTQLDTLSDGRPVAGVADWIANLFTRYRFVRGPLKNLTIGGGVNLVGSTFIGTRTVGTNTIFDRTSSYRTYSALLAYDMKVRGYEMKLQLNVLNVADDQALRFTAMNPDGTPLQFRITPPRAYRLSASVRF